MSAIQSLSLTNHITATSDVDGSIDMATVGAIVKLNADTLEAW